MKKAKIVAIDVSDEQQLIQQPTKIKREETTKEKIKGITRDSMKLIIIGQCTDPLIEANINNTKVEVDIQNNFQRVSDLVAILELAINKKNSLNVTDEERKE